MNFDLSCKNPGAKIETKNSGNISAKTTKSINEKNNSEKIWFKNKFIFSFASIILGTNDWAIAPSPKKLLKTLGILKITTKTS